GGAQSLGVVEHQDGRAVPGRRDPGEVGRSPDQVLPQTWQPTSERHVVVEIVALRLLDGREVGEGEVDARHHAAHRAGYPAPSPSTPPLPSPAVMPAMKTWLP